MIEILRKFQKFHPKSQFQMKVTEPQHRHQGPMRTADESSQVKVPVVPDIINNNHVFRDNLLTPMIRR